MLPNIGGGQNPQYLKSSRWLKSPVREASVLLFCVSIYFLLNLMKVSSFLHTRVTRNPRPVISNKGSERSVRNHVPSMANHLEVRVLYPS